MDSSPSLTNLTEKDKRGKALVHSSALWRGSTALEAKFAVGSDERPCLDHRTWCSRV